MRRARSCKRQRIAFKTRDGRVSFTGRPGGSRYCGKRKPKMTARGRKVRACSTRVMVEAQKFCDAATRGEPSLRRGCVVSALRQLSRAANCGGR